MAATFDQVTVHGRQQAFFVMPQPTDALVAPVGAVATSTTGGPLRVYSTDIAVKVAREVHEMSQEGRRVYSGQTYSGMMEVPISISTPVIPGSSLTGVPESFHLLKSVLGSGSFSSGVNSTFGPADLNVAQRLSLARLLNVDAPRFGEWVRDFIPNEFKMEWAGGSPPKFTFTGEAANVIQASKGLAATLSGSTLTLQAGYEFALEAGTRVEIAGDNNSGAGWLIASVDSTGLIYTVTGTPSVSISGGESVLPYMPARTYSSQAPIGAVSGSVKFGSVDLPCTGFDFTANLGTEYVKDEVGSAAMTDGPPGMSTLGGNITLRATENVLKFLPASGQFAAKNLVVTCGTASPRLVTFTAPQIEIDREKLSVDAARGTVAMPFRALDSADGAADAFSLVFS
tara:strand:- start:3332 stop:4528 length:1197 start_codon:yes stop_codon:yes gene_type:complete